MLKNLFLLTATIFVYTSSFLGAAMQQDPSLQELMLSDLNVIKYNMTFKYAPKEWKKEHLNWDLEEEYQKAVDKIVAENATSPKEYQKIAKQFFNSSRDYHVKVLSYSTEWSWFPINVKTVEGKYLISELLSGLSISNLLELFLIQEQIEEQTDPFFAQTQEFWDNISLGDEILEIDGKPIAKVIDTLIKEDLGHDTSLTGHALAERMLFMRKGLYGHEVPSGNFTLKIRHQNKSKTKTYNLCWLYIPEHIKNKSPFQEKESKGFNNFFKKDFSVHFAKDLLLKNVSKKTAPKGGKYSDEDDDDEDEDWREKGFLPELGEVLWETDSEENELYAYLYKNEKGQKIGYLYITDFCGDESLIEEIKGVLERLNQESEALVLDITNNPGGSLFYMYGILSMLTDKPLQCFTDREIILQNNVFEALQIKKLLLSDWIETDSNGFFNLDGYYIHKDEIDKIIGYLDDITRSWDEGKLFTDPLHIFGIDAIQPSPEVQYNKPILLLINELDFSCADFFPAMLQDNGRATLFGQRTAGAGGYVLFYPHVSRFGIMGYSLTGSIGYRLNGMPLENLGVSPDIPNKVTTRDIRENYSDYVKSVNREVQKLL